MSQFKQLTQKKGKIQQKWSECEQQTDPDQLELMFRRLEMMLVDGGVDQTFA